MEQDVSIEQVKVPPHPPLPLALPGKKKNEEKTPRLLKETNEKILYRKDGKIERLI